MTTRPALRAWRSNAAPSPPNSRTCPPTACARWPRVAASARPPMPWPWYRIASPKNLHRRAGHSRRAACRDPRRGRPARPPANLFPGIPQGCPHGLRRQGPGPHRHARGSAGRLCRIRRRALRAGSADAAGLRDLRGAGARLRRRQRGVPVARNVHRDGILAVSTASAAGQDAATQNARPAPRRRRSPSRRVWATTACCAWNSSSSRTAA